MRIFIALTLITIFNSILIGKDIKGIVVDSSGNVPLPGATVIVNSLEGKVLGGTSTDNKGFFIIESIRDDKIKIHISMIGYETLLFETILTEKITDFGNIKLKASAIKLSDVVIKSTRPMVEYFVDKQVINIDRVPGNSGSVADALRNSGLVEVDQSTNKVSIRGNSEVKILIDGKPMEMAENILGQLPATSVDKVEVITSASAKDDPEGDAGILNIVTKKGALGNYNGSVSLTGSSSKMNFGSIMLNYRAGKFNFFTNLMGGFGGMRYDNSSDRTNFNSPGFYLLKSSGRSDMDGYLTNGKLGFDFDYDTANTFTLSGSFYKLNWDQDDRTINNIYNSSNAFVSDYVLKNDGEMDNTNYTVTGFYKRKFNGTGTEFTLDAFYSFLSNDFDTELKTIYGFLPDYPLQQKTDNGIKNKTVIIKSDYVTPTSIGKIETGYHYTFRDRDNDYGILNYSYVDEIWQDSLNYSNIFNYKENIHALYLMYTNNISKFEFKFGLRAEQTYAEGDQVTTGENFKNEYTSYFPSIFLAYKLNQQMQINFNISRRINRPRMEYINPFTKYNGPNNYSAGNPKLEPTYVNLYELKFAQFLNLYYSQSKGNPQAVETTIQDSIAFSSRVNLASVKTYGLELTIPYVNSPMFPFKLPEFINFIYIRYNLNKSVQSGNYLSEDLSYSRVFWNVSANMGLKIWWDLDFMTSLRYNPKITDERTVTNPMTMLVFVLSRDFWEKKLKVSLVFNDVLKASNRRIETFGSNFYSNVDFVNARSQGVFLSLNYSFNDFQNRKERNIDDGRDKSDTNFMGN